jgi:hypothetical protein
MPLLIEHGKSIVTAAGRPRRVLHEVHFVRGA